MKFLVLDALVNQDLNEEDFNDNGEVLLLLTAGIILYRIFF